MFSIIKILLSPLAVIYAFIINMRNYLFDNNYFSIKRVNAKVISIGNLTVGGSGKTPAVIYIANTLKTYGRKVGVLSRGYRRKSSGYLLVSDGTGIKTSVDKCGDEIFLTAEECAVACAVAEKRVAGTKKFLNDVDLDTIVLDDAFQHRWIHRDLNILMFDQRFVKIAGRLEQKLLPLGYMREPFSSIERADLIIINRKFSEKTGIPVKLKKYFGTKPVYYAYYKTNGFYDLKDHKFYAVEEFIGQKSLVICGVAQPHSFIKILQQNKIDTKNKLFFPDHKNYSTKEVQLIRKRFYDTNSYSVIATQKDAVKLTKFARELDDIDIFYLKIELEIEDKDDFNNLLISKIS